MCHLLLLLFLSLKKKRKSSLLLRFFFLKVFIVENDNTIILQINDTREKYNDKRKSGTQSEGEGGAVVKVKF